MIKIQNTNLLCQQYLDILYKGSIGFQNKVKISETYGEILFPGIQKIISNLEINPQDIFLDLGSGLGKVVMQLFLQTLVKEAYGIEILPALHHQAVKIVQTFKQEIPEFFSGGNRKLNFLLGDFMTLELPPATIVLISSRCFTPKLLRAVEEKLENLPTIRALISLRPLHSMKRLSFKKTLRIECSWDTALCYLYSV